MGNTKDKNKNTLNIILLNNFESNMGDELVRKDNFLSMNGNKNAQSAGTLFKYKGINFLNYYHGDELIFFETVDRIFLGANLKDGRVKEHKKKELNSMNEGDFREDLNSLIAKGDFGTFMEFLYKNPKSFQVKNHAKPCESYDKMFERVYSLFCDISEEYREVISKGNSENILLVTGTPVIENFVYNLVKNNKESLERIVNNTSKKISMKEIRMNKKNIKKINSFSNKINFLGPGDYFTFVISYAMDFAFLEEIHFNGKKKLEISEQLKKTK